MKILHITPHLGGGVGKAHSEVCAASDKTIKRTFALLEEPRDRRFSDRIVETGAKVTFVPDFKNLAELANGADIVQFEFWNHPKIYQAMALGNFAPIRSVIWCHISGLFAPFIAPGLLKSADRFLFTSPCSFASPSVAKLNGDERARLGVVGSGFGFDDIQPLKPSTHSVPRIGYLGTVDFAKMHPGIFDIIDAVEGVDFILTVWGGYDPDGDVVKAHQAMKHPDRVVLKGHCADPKSAMLEMDLFFYPLQPQHYGTAENALIEAMSLSLAPFVMANPAEMAIVRDEETGFIASSVQDASKQLSALLTDPQRITRIGQAAAREVAALHKPSRSAALFQSHYEALEKYPKSSVNFASAVGTTPKDWFLSTQAADVAANQFLSSKAASKGSLSHFLASFPEDEGLHSLL